MGPGAVACYVRYGLRGMVYDFTGLRFSFVLSLSFLDYT
jgi:hypothetical protein